MMPKVPARVFLSLMRMGAGDTIPITNTSTLNRQLRYIADEMRSAYSGFQRTRLPCTVEQLSLLVWPKVDLFGLLLVPNAVM
jgi:hypothetical protein